MFVQTLNTPNPNSLKFLPGEKVSLSGPLEITDKNSIVIFNHINMFDALIMYSLFKNPPAIVARQEYITNFPLKLFNNSGILKSCEMGYDGKGQ